MAIRITTRTDSTGRFRRRRHGTCAGGTVAALLVATVCAAQEKLNALDAGERAEAARIAMVERVAPAVVSIFDADERGGGSGVLIDEEGYGVTNFHVVAEMLESRRGLGGLNDGKLYELEVLGIDPGGDLAMFRLTGLDRFPAAPLGNSDHVRVGDTVIAMGNPFVLADDYSPTVTVGIVSGVNRYQWGSGDKLLYSDCIQVDASINPGNSGGPLFNLHGEVIGINGRISVSMRGRVNVGMGYAITANQVKRFAPGLRAGLLVEHGTMQAIVRDQPDGEVIFVDLLEDAPAWGLGVRPGNPLLEFDGRPIRSANAYASILGTLPANWPVAVTFRDGNGEEVRGVARTEPIRLEIADQFEPDPNVNMVAVERVIARFRHLVGADRLPAKPTDPWRWLEQRVTAAAGEEQATEYRVQVRGTRSMTYSPVAGGQPTIHVDSDGARFDGPQGRHPLPRDLDLVHRALFHLYCTVLPAVQTADMAAFRHLGADNLVSFNQQGQSTTKLLEVVAVPIGAHATARFGFAVDSGQLRRIIAEDTPTGETVTLTFASADPWRGRVRVESASGVFTFLRREAEPSLSATGDSPVPLPEGSGQMSAHGPSAAVIDHLSARVVKLIGAKIGRSQGYGSGILVSADGLVLTVDSGLLDASHIRAHLGDGSRHGVEVLYADRQRHLALLRLGPSPADEVPDTVTSRFSYFDLSPDVPLKRGQRLLAGGNPFKVAAGAERISVAQGVYGGTIKLDATRGTDDFPYRGEVLLIDAITSTPGFPGAALVDLEGRLVGMIGRVVKARATHTMLNYAIPAKELRSFLEVARDPEARLAGGPSQDSPPAAPGYHGIKFFELGYRSNPVYVDRVKRRSPAARAGVRSDDLVLGANGQPVPTLVALRRILGDCREGDTLELTLMRNEKIRKVSIVLEKAP